MIYSDQTRKAMKLCYHAHAGQVDKSGTPYVFHPIHLAEQMDDECSTVAALLHDVVEDTDYTFDDLREMGFSEAVLEVLMLLTHQEDVSYMEYVRNLSVHPVARKVKLADLCHNMDTTRMGENQPVNEARLEKYRRAMRYLQEKDVRE